MNKKGMDMLTAMGSIGDEMLLDALPPGMGTYKKKEKSNRFSGFFERPIVVAVISASVALVVLTGIVWAGRQAGQSPKGPEYIAGNPGYSENDRTAPPYEENTRPNYENPPVPDDAKIIVSSGGYTIAPAEYLQWKLTWNADEEKFIEERGDMQWSELMPELDSGGDESRLLAEISKLPRVPYDDDFNLTVSNRPLELLSATAYKEYQQSYKFAYGVALDTGLHTVKDMMTELSEGSYYILVVAYERGADVSTDVGPEGTMYEFVFRIDVFGESSTQPPRDPYNDDFEPINVKICVSSDQWAVALRPYVISALQYDESLGGWADVNGLGLERDLPQKHAELPTLRYSENLHLYIKEIDGTATPRYLQIFDEDFNELDMYRTSEADFPWYPEALRTLAHGSYYIVLTCHQKGVTIDDQTESGTYQYGFKLTVGSYGEQDTETAITPAMNVEVWAGYHGTAYRQLTPILTNTRLYNDAEEAWTYVSGDGWYDKVKAGTTAVPTLTYAYSFGVFFTHLDKTTTANYQGIAIYDEALQKQYSYHDITEDLYQLAELPVGTYYIQLTVLFTGRKIGQDIEKGTYEYIFKLIIPENVEDVPPSTGELDSDKPIVTSGGRRINPVVQNQWTEKELEMAMELHLLPEVYDKLCSVIFPNEAYRIRDVVCYKIESHELKKVMSRSVTDPDLLQQLESGRYCVVFSAEWPDASDDGTMCLGYFAFLLSVDEQETTASVGNVAEEPETVHPTEYS